MRRGAVPSETDNLATSLTFSSGRPTWCSIFRSIFDFLGHIEFNHPPLLCCNFVHYFGFFGKTGVLGGLAHHNCSAPTFVIAMPCANSKTSCECSSERAVRSPGAGSIPPAETLQVRPIAAIPSNETNLMLDTCAGASIFPRGFDQRATDDSKVAPVRLSTATDDPVHGDAGKKSCFVLRDGRKLQFRYNEAGVSFPIVSIGEASQQGSWLVFGPCCQAMLPGSSGVSQEMCEGPKRGKVGETPRSVLVAVFGDGTHGRSTVVPNPRAARSAVEAPPISVPDPDAALMQLEESEETRRLLPANVSKEEFDAHQLTHLAFRSWCDHCARGKAVDNAHRPRIDPHRGEAKMGKEFFFLARATDSQHVKAVLNCLDFQSGAVFSATVVKGCDPYALAVALEAIKFTGRTNLVDTIRDSRTQCQ